MKVVLGSQNPPKLNATKNAFEAAFPNSEITVACITTELKVSSHPVSVEESFKGAFNRALHASQLIVDGDYYVGIEGGLQRLAERAWEIGWVVIRNSEGLITTGLSSGIEFKGKILRGIISGMELNDVIEKEFGIAVIGNNNGFYGLATNDLVTRQMAYEQGVKFALAQFLHPEFYSD